MLAHLAGAVVFVLALPSKQLDVHYKKYRALPAASLWSQHKPTFEQLPASEREQRTLPRGASGAPTRSEVGPRSSSARTSTQRTLGFALGPPVTTGFELVLDKRRGLALQT